MPTDLTPVDAAETVPARTQGTLASALGGALGAAPGAVLGAVFGAAAAVRRTKPLHPLGRVGHATLQVTTPLPELEIPLFADPGTRFCLARWSRAIGLPDPLPDFEGLAVRFESPTADLLFATTGTGRLSRYLLVPRMPGAHGEQTTMLPVDTAAGPVVFKATPSSPAADEPPSRFELAASVRGGPWQPIGTLSAVWGADQPLRFDPVRNVLPGTRQYPLVRFLREPAYSLARWGATART